MTPSEIVIATLVGAVVAWLLFSIVRQVRRDLAAEARYAHQARVRAETDKRLRAEDDAAAAAWAAIKAAGRAPDADGVVQAHRAAYPKRLKRTPEDRNQILRDLLEMGERAGVIDTPPYLERLSALSYMWDRHVAYGWYRHMLMRLAHRDLGADGAWRAGSAVAAWLLFDRDLFPSDAGDRLDLARALRGAVASGRAKGEDLTQFGRAPSDPDLRHAWLWAFEAGALMVHDPDGAVQAYGAAADLALRKAAWGTDRSNGYVGLVVAGWLADAGRPDDAQVCLRDSVGMIQAEIEAEMRYDHYEGMEMKRSLDKRLSELVARHDLTDPRRSMGIAR